ncbi:TetR/AcrR family transcriptional regulator [Streptomyces sp. NPDC050636]|uniref:TetR/AcrR family transcriptional regulator n=1 Tax=Streptomyces sp. NPDC050636 TaxID=3154510 RepID=UPI00341F3330
MYKNSILKPCGRLHQSPVGNRKEGRALNTNAPGSRKRGRPPRLSREQIVEAAYRIVRDEGAENLTMRRLSRVLGSTPMALYHHVRDKDELLTLVLEHVAQDLPRPPLPDNPRERIIVVCELMHRAFVDNPWVVPVVARGELVGLSAVWMTEEIIGALIDSGLGREQAFWTHQTIWYYTAGQTLHTPPREPSQDTGERAPHYPKVAATEPSPTAFPHLAKVAGDSRQLEAQYSYRLGLTHILDGALPPGSALR